jgi:vacuolar protein sorting-associated protein 13A/C
VDVRVFSFSIIISLDYLLKIKDFFDVSSQSVQHNQTQSLSRPPCDQAVKKKVVQPTPSQPNTMMTINLHIEKPDIILLEDMDDIDSNCMILNVIYYHIITTNIFVRYSNW